MSSPTFVLFLQLCVFPKFFIYINNVDMSFSLSNVMYSFTLYVVSHIINLFVLRFFVIRIFLIRCCTNILVPLKVTLYDLCKSQFL